MFIMLKMKKIALIILLASVTGCCSTNSFKKELGEVLGTERENFGSYHSVFSEFFRGENDSSVGATEFLMKEFRKEHLDSGGLARDFNSIICPAP
jgi:hypothetical protein